MSGTDEELEAFLASDELWGMTGSIVYQAGYAPTPEAQWACEEAFRTLGEWQSANGLATPDVTAWITFFRLRREAPYAPGRGSFPGVRSVRPAVPWGVRDVWFGILMAAVLYGVALGILFLVAMVAQEPDVDIWTAIVTLLELLFLVPVWWFALRKPGGSLKALGFVKFPGRVLGIGAALLVAFYFFQGLYALLLDGFGLDVQTDLTPLVEELSNPWPLFIAIAIIAPLVEETLFRGFIFAGLRTRYDWRVAGAISAALFSAAHLEWTFFIPGFILGFLFAYLYERSNSIWPGMILHAAINWLAVGVLYATLYL